MNNKQARSTGRTILVCGCFLIVLNQLWLGLAMAVIGFLFSAILGRCPHCGKLLIGVSSSVTHCPKCHGQL